MRRHNSTIATNNMFSYRGVEWRSDRGKFRARILCPENPRGKWLGTFDAAEEAALAYDKAARDVYGDEAFLNFPQDGEKGILLHSRSDGKCINGHDLKENGYDRPDGDGVNCRICNAKASATVYERKKRCDTSTNSD